MINDSGFGERQALGPLLSSCALMGIALTGSRW